MSDRDMERARELLSALDGYTASPRPARDTRRLAAALAAEREPLDTRIAELEAELDRDRAQRDEYERCWRRDLAELERVRGELAAESRRLEASLRAWSATGGPRAGFLAAVLEAGYERGARWGIEAAADRVEAYIEARERSEDAAQPYAAGLLGALTHAAGLIRGQVDAADVVRAAREREAPAAEPARPLAVGDRVRVVWCCVAGMNRPRCGSCHEQEGQVGTLDEMHDGDDGYHVNHVGWVSKVERVEPASEQAPAAEPARPLAVGDRVRVVRCCPTPRALCCGTWRGHVGELVRIVEGARLPYQIADPDGRSLYFAEVERVEPASEPAAERPLTHEAMARLLRAVLAAGETYTGAELLRKVARRLEVRDA